MTMHANGLTKLMEECGELIQIAAKKSAYPHTDYHPDGNGSMQDRLEEEIADVMAAVAFVGIKLGLNEQRIEERCRRKFCLFAEWDADPTC